MHKIASESYALLKEENPEELENILQSIFGVFEKEKELVEQEIKKQKSSLAEAQKRLDELKKAFKRKPKSLSQARSHLWKEHRDGCPRRTQSSVQTYNGW